LIAIAYAPDTSVEAEVEKGGINFAKDLVESISKLDDTLLITLDSRNFSSMFDGTHTITHVPCGIGHARTLGFAIYSIKGFLTLVRHRRKLTGVISMTPACLHNTLFAAFCRKPHFVSYDYDLPNQLVTVQRDFGIGLIARVVERLTLRQAAMIRVVSSDQLAHVKSHAKCPVVLIPNWVDFETINHIRDSPQLPRTPSHKTILYVGRLHPVKRVEDLILAFSSLLHAIPEAELVFVGDGPEREKLELLAKSLKCEDRVTFTGFLQHDEVIGYMLSCVALVLCSLEEGNPRVLIEGLACRIPIVSTDVLGIRELIRDGENGILVPPRSPSRLTEALVKVLKDDQLRSKLTDSGFKFASETFDKDKCLARLNKGIREAFPDLSGTRTVTLEISVAPRSR